MKDERHKALLAVHILLLDGDKVLLTRRFNTGYMDGFYSLPAGHIEENEPARKATARETKEEIDVLVKEENLKLVHLMHIKTNKFYIYLFFEASIWDGKPHICEPDKCDDLGFFPLDDLPPDITPATKHVLECVKRGDVFSELGWN